jgi:hypothetical protein
LGPDLCAEAFAVGLCTVFEQGFPNGLFVGFQSPNLFPDLGQSVDWMRVFQHG